MNKKKKIIIAVVCVLVAAAVIAAVFLLAPQKERTVDSGRESPQVVEYSVSRDDKSIVCSYRGMVENPNYTARLATYGEERIKKIAELYGMDSETASRLAAKPESFRLYTLTFNVYNASEEEKCIFGVNELKALPKGLWISGDKTSTVLKVQPKENDTWVLELMVDGDVYPSESDDFYAAVESMELSIEYSKTPPLDENGDYKMEKRFESKIVFE